MKLNNLVLCLGLLLATQGYSDEWYTSYTNALESLKLRDWQNAEKYLSDAIANSGSNHPYLLVERGSAYYLDGKYELAIEDINKALKMNLSGYDRDRALITRSSSYYMLEKFDEAIDDYREFRKVSSYIPQIERTEDSVIIRNAPQDCKARKQYIEALTKIYNCEENDIEELPNKVIIVKKKPRFEVRVEDTCKWWCDKAAVAGQVYCSRFSFNMYCLGACIAVVETLREVCHDCCTEGTFYKKCVKPFEDILQYLGENCDPI